MKKFSQDMKEEIRDKLASIFLDPTIISKHTFELALHKKGLAVLSVSPKGKITYITHDGYVIQGKALGNYNCPDVSALIARNTV